MARVITTVMMQRIEDEAKYYLKDGETLRSTAKEFGLSKSQVQNDISLKLKEIGRPDLHEQVQLKLQSNLKERASRGGQNRWKNRRNEVKVNG